MLKPEIYSFSGPSSSGKSAVIQMLREHFEKLGKSVETRPSLSRVHVPKEMSLEERSSAQFQLFLLDEALKLESSVLEKKSDIVLLDRTILDGYVYLYEYDTATTEQLEGYYSKVTEVLESYTASFFLNAVIWSDDTLRKEYDRQFATQFKAQFFRFWPTTSSAVVEVPAIVGIEEIVNFILPTIHNTSKTIRKAII